MPNPYLAQKLYYVAPSFLPPLLSQDRPFSRSFILDISLVYAIVMGGSAWIELQNSSKEC
jgi:hypothetical protein